LSGHSKWASIKHKKMATDAKRGKLFTKMIREIMMAAKSGGPSVDNNPRLRIAIERAKGENMPNDNIQRAIKKGTGEDGGTVLEQVTYEGYGAGGVAVYVEGVTDNKNRSAAEIRSTFSRHNGNLGSAGCVAWMFERKCQLSVKKDQVAEDDLMALILDAGADDLSVESDRYEITTSPESFEAVKKAIEDRKIAVESGSVTLVPKNTTRVEGRDAENVLKLLDDLEENEDVQAVYANFDIPDEIIDTIAR